jgi:hypothetical protein
MIIMLKQLLLVLRLLVRNRSLVQATMGIIIIIIIKVMVYLLKTEKLAIYAIIQLNQILKSIFLKSIQLSDVCYVK